MVSTTHLKNLHKSNWIISPNFGVKIENFWVATTQNKLILVQVLPWSFSQLVVSQWPMAWPSLKACSWHFSLANHHFDVKMKLSTVFLSCLSCSTAPWHQRCYVVKNYVTKKNYDFHILSEHNKFVALRCASNRCCFSLSTSPRLPIFARFVSTCFPNLSASTQTRKLLRS